MSDANKALYLCAGLQSSGSTLMSYCFLQRRDMDGVLDASGDLLFTIRVDTRAPRVWFKTTISSFRLSELMEHYSDEAWTVHPLLVVRDVRHVWASLFGKSYARNGTTPEDPPFRMRLRRFLKEWQLFRANGWPIIRYESVLEDPVASLQDACSQLRLPWDDCMVRWPKRREDIACTQGGNMTFWRTCGCTLGDTVANYARRQTTNMSLEVTQRDLEWMESEFSEFNVVNGYRKHLEIAHALKKSQAQPRFELSRRYWWELHRTPLRWVSAKLGRGYEKLITARSVKGSS